MPLPKRILKEMEKIPSFVRTVVMKRMEAFVRERGHAQITVDMLDEIRAQMPVDFSRRCPFFLGERS